MIKRFLKFLKLSNTSSLIESNIQNKEEDLITFKEDEDFTIQKIFNKDFYKSENVENAESWLFYNYFNHSDSLIEKKYKLVALSIVCDRKRLYLNKMPMILDIVKEFSQELIEAQETSINLYKAFPIYSEFPTPRKYRNTEKGIDLIVKFFSEDQNVDMNLVKKAYQRFLPLGLLANNFIDSKSSDLFMELQDSKFTQHDILVFKQFVKEVTDPKYDSYHTVLLSAEHWKPLILNEYNLDNLNLFKQVCLNDKGKSSGAGIFGGVKRYQQQKDTREEDKQHLIDFIEKRIAYLELGSDLALPTEEQNKKVKRAKL